MESYLPQLEHFFIEKEEASTPVAELLGAPLCPYLIHTLIPYVMTLSHGGVFHWMVSVDPDAVVLQCPNPQESVACLLKRWTGDNATMRLEASIQSVKGHCPYGHAAGQKIPIPSYRDYGERYHIFDVIFPWLIYGAATQRSFGVSLGYPAGNGAGAKKFRLDHKGPQPSTGEGLRACSVDGSGEVVLKSCEHRCRYHRWPRRERYAASQLVYGGLCPDFFHVVYPWALTKIYESGLKVAVDPVPVELTCPSAQISMRLRMHRKPLRSAALRRTCIGFFSRLGKSVDWPFYGIHMEITGGASGCPRGHRPGQRFSMNLGFGRSMCPAAFDAFYPFWHAMARGIDLVHQFGVFVEGLQVQCPDVVSQNVYRWVAADEK